MFGIRIRIEYDGFGVNLRPFCKADLPNLVEHFDSMKVHMFTKGLFAQTLENEEEWYERNRNDQTTCVWAIVPDGSDVVVGTTGLHDTKNIHGSCYSGIIIWDDSLWGKGIATRAHLGRTRFAAGFLNRTTIKSAARVNNEASVRALARVGYNKIGVEPRTTTRDGEYLDTQLFTWLHPGKIGLLFPEGLPEVYEEGVALAKIALGKARQVVSFP